MNQTFGYIRVSSKDQNDKRQRIALAAYGIPPRNLYCDKQSGKDFCRPAYQRLLKRLRPGDLLLVKSIDRLGRNYEEILQLSQIDDSDMSTIYCHLTINPNYGLKIYGPHFRVCGFIEIAFG